MGQLCTSNWAPYIQLGELLPAPLYFDFPKLPLNSFSLNNSCIKDGVGHVRGIVSICGLKKP